MAVLLNPYLSFRDQAKEAMEFYRSVFGGEVTTSVFGDYGMGGADEAAKIMHARLDADGLVLMAADTPNEAPYEQGNAFSVSLSGGAGDEQRLRSNWEGLAAGAKIIEPFETAPWGDVFGILVDKFGVTWMVNIEQAPADAG
ncbi:VOC family protein [Agromyces marinus]|uniref:VOC family protein n=1 Tax=Agromyces marinus TaxID=1389020 RepID=UPI001F25B619|nr:VOC family protein [Agromyces marinus]UIP59569.1 hypothetical protein DSM26151_24800 [Agromyces marinus]